MKQFKKIIMITLAILLTFHSTAYAADYKVVKNDSLYKISQLFKVPIDTMKKDNKLKTDAINPGQVLKIPALEYKVIKGDTLNKIAKKYGVSVTSIKKANNKSNDIIKIGQKLTIPGVKPVGSSTTTTVSSSTKPTVNGSAKTVSGSSAVIPYTNAEVNLLARLIEAEAGGESYQAKVAVGAVVVNRVESKDWAPTINDVINQKIDGYYQFTPVKIGTIYNPASAASTQAAWEALGGNDPSKGAIFYFDNSCTNQWLWAKPQTAVIDHMVFAK